MFVVSRNHHIYLWGMLCCLLLLLAACGSAPPAADAPAPGDQTTTDSTTGQNGDTADLSSGLLPAETGVVVLLTPQASTNSETEQATVDAAQPASATDNAQDDAQTATPISIEDLEFSPTTTPTPSRSPTATMTPMDEETDERTETPTPTATPTEEITEEPTPTLDPRPVVPNLIGMGERSARNRLLQLDPTLLVRVEETGQCSENGVIVSTFPPAGDPIDQNGEVILTICVLTATPTPIPLPTPEPALVMPNLVGLTEQQARNQMAQLGSTIPVQVSYQVAGCTEDGLVTATSPSVGMPVNPSIGVVLTLCAAPTPVPQPTPIPQPTGPLMPYVIGKHPDEARKQLQDMGVEPSFELVDSNCDRQTVVSSYPGAGEPIDPAVGVSIGVCAPPPDN